MCDISRERLFERTELLYGRKGMEKLYNSSVLIFGIGGVGGYVTEALARSGIGRLDLVDSDTVSVSNINRQIIATVDTIGRYKTEVMRDRISTINREADVRVYNTFVTPDNITEFDFSEYTYVIDAVDTVSAKIEIILRAQAADVPVISSMGAGNKLDPTRFRVADIYKTSVCPLAKTMRYELKRRGVKKLKTVFSDEPAAPHDPEAESRFSAENNGRRYIPASNAFVPSAAGLVIASQVIKDILGNC
ncbi:MAG: tRNA threonylcarbamoyladenosine dehydratase [Oscillospiraceae bacterium]|nr:tRNA threonylcarbamoyladenosine dehydratase [Oscillospiraceae bacterium]